MKQFSRKSMSKPCTTRITIRNRSSLLRTTPRSKSRSTAMPLKSIQKTLCSNLTLSPATSQTHPFKTGYFYFPMAKGPRRMFNSPKATRTRLSRLKSTSIRTPLKIKLKKLSPAALRIRKGTAMRLKL